MEQVSVVIYCFYPDFSLSPSNNLIKPYFPFDPLTQITKSVRERREGRREKGNGRKLPIRKLNGSEVAAAPIAFFFAHPWSICLTKKYL